MEHKHTSNPENELENNEVPEETENINIEEAEEPEQIIEEWETDMPDEPEPEKPKKGFFAFLSRIFGRLVEDDEDEEDEEENNEEEDISEEDILSESEEDFSEEETLSVSETGSIEDFSEENTLSETEEKPEEDFAEEIVFPEFEQEPEDAFPEFEEEEFSEEDIFPELDEEETDTGLFDAPEKMPDFSEDEDTDSQLEMTDIITLETPEEQDEEYQDNEEEENQETDEDSEDEEDDEEESKPKRNFFAAAIPVAAVMVIALAFTLCFQLGLFDEKEVYRMPDLVGMNYYDLQENYTGLDIQINQSDYSAYDKDMIYAQDVPVGTEIKLGQTVNVDISLGYAMTPVPDVRNYQFEYAQKLLEQTGFATEILYEQSLNGTAVDNVIRTVPSSGEEAVEGSKVLIYVSEGLGAENAQVQTFTGMLLDDAIDLCEMYGLQVETVAAPALEAENVVVAQSIEAGTTVPFHTIITLTYSNGEQPEGTVPFQLNFPAYANGRFILDFIDAEGNVIASSDMIVAGFSAGSAVPVEGLGAQDITVVLNNYATNLQAEIGTYHFDFTTGTYTVLTEDMQTAFETVKGIG